MKINVYNLEGKVTGEMNLSEAVFGIKIKPEVVHEVFVALTNNQRESWADTKGKGEVRGGGKKPWQQKGTGRARHGSIRSPIWKGGGVTFGPLSVRNYKTKINKKLKRLATQMCLADRAQHNALMVVEDFNFSEPKTKAFVQFIKALPVQFKSLLVLTPGKNQNLVRMTRNVSSVKTVRVEDVNVMDLLSTAAVIINKPGVEKLEAALSKN